MKDKLTLEDILSCVTKEEYVKVGLKTTICVLTLTNGFEVVGVSGCVNPENYNLEIGSKIAKERALDKVWELEGYQLQCARYVNQQHAALREHGVIHLVKEEVQEN